MWQVLFTWQEIFWEVYMLNFEEELEKFQPIPDVGDVEDLVYHKELTDMTDIMKVMINQNGNNQNK